MSEPVRFSLDGVEVESRPDETIWQVAKRCGTRIPHLCYADEPGYRADGNCRACMVEIEGERVLAASCIRTPAPGMKVATSTARAQSARNLVMELLVADQPTREVAHDPASKLWHWAEDMGVTSSRFPSRAAPDPDASHVAMRVNLDACIHCNLCVRACREVQVNDVIGLAYRGHGSKIVFDFDDPMGASTCVACGECVQACPTGGADGSGAGGRERSGPHRTLAGGGERLPLLRGGLPDQLPGRGQPDRRGPRAATDPPISSASASRAASASTTSVIPIALPGR